MILSTLKKKQEELTNAINNRLKRVSIPGGRGISLYDLVSQFKAGIGEGSLTTRASSISFKFFVALFPAIIFVFTITPLIPLEGFYSTLMQALDELLPDQIYPFVERTINDIIGRRNTGLLSFGILFALYFSSSSFISLISSFNQSINVRESRSPLQQRVISIILVVITTTLVIIAISIMILGQGTIEWLTEHGYIQTNISYLFLPAIRWGILSALIYTTISMIYFIAPTRSAGFKFFSVGSLIATFCLVLLAWGFGFFIKHFTAYNVLYGSIGTLLMMLLYIYYNATILLIGFELNASIHAARRTYLAATQE